MQDEIYSYNIYTYILEKSGGKWLSRTKDIQSYLYFAILLMQQYILVTKYAYENEMH